MLTRAHAAALDVVEAAYAPHDTTQAWLAGIVQAVQPALEHGLGVIGHTFRLSAEGRLVIEDVATAGPVSPTLAETTHGILTSYTPEMVRQGLQFGCETVSQMFARTQMSFEDAAIELPLAAEGIRDGVGLTGKDARGFGYTIAASSPTLARLLPVEQAIWTRVALHVLAGQRLRHLRPSPATEGAEGEAVLDARYRVVHAEGEALPAREVLRAAARSVDGARSRAGRADPEGALAAWRALVRARWSIVDRFDSDGRRYIVAMCNEPAAPGPELLTKRERQVLDHAARGLSNKEVAYALGLSPSTVSSHLVGGMRKLGLRSRSELAAMFVRGGVVTAPVATDGSQPGPIRGDRSPQSGRA